MPVGFHPADGGLWAAKGGGVPGVQLGKVAPQLLAGGSGPAPPFAEQGRICDQTPACHQALQARPARRQGGQVRGSGDVPVVADGGFAGGQGRLEGVPVGLPPVELAHHPGVDDQPGQGVAVVDFEDGAELLRPLHPNAGLDRDGPARLGEHGVQKAVQSVQVPQHPGPLALGGDGAGGAPEIQVDLGVAHLPQHPDHPGGAAAVLAQQLGDDRCAGVGRGGQLGHFLFDGDTVLGRGEEGRVIPVRPAEPALVGLPPDPVGQPLHGGRIILHSISPLVVSLTR